MLLSAVIEKVTGKPYHEYVNEFVKQMGLNNTCVEPTPESRQIVPGKMPGYYFQNGKLKMVPELNVMHLSGSSGMISSLSDLTQLGKLIARTFSGTDSYIPGVKSDVFRQALSPPFSSGFCIGIRPEGTKLNP